MAVYLNAKGTTNASFQIGKRGNKFFGGVSSPDSSNVVDGDVWLDNANGDFKIASVSNGTVTWSSIVASGDSFSANDLTVTGNLTVNGTQTVINTTTLDVEDNIITLNSNFTGADNVVDAGIEVNRGEETNVSFLWDEAEGEWTLGAETLVAGGFIGNLHGNVIGSLAPNGVPNSVVANTLTAGNATFSEQVSFNGTGNSVLISDALRIAETGSGLRMTNVGAFDNSDGDFRIFSTDNLILSTNGDSGTAVTFDKNTKDAVFQGNVTVNNAYTLPSVDGTAGQFLQTDGSGGITFSSEFTDLSITGTATYNTVEYQNSNIMKFNQMYTGASTGSYFTNGEYQKVVTIIPSGVSQNYQVVGRITAQNAGETHTVYFDAALRSGDPLEDLSWSVFYDEEYNGARYIDPQLWTKETTTAGFIFAFKTLATIYGTVTIDMEVIPRISSQKDNVSVNTVQNSEQSAVESGYTINDMTLRTRKQSTTLTTKDISIEGNVTVNNAYALPSVDGTANQVLTTDGSGTLSFTTVNANPDGSNTQVQFNNADSFGASTGFTFDDSGDILSTGIIKSISFEQLTDYAVITDSSNIASDLGSITSNVGAKIDQGLVVTDYGYPILPSVNVANLPSGQTAGTFLFCPNESGGATIVFYDGSDWRRIQDRAVIS